MLFSCPTMETFQSGLPILIIIECSSGNKSHVNVSRVSKPVEKYRSKLPDCDIFNPAQCFVQKSHLLHTNRMHAHT